MKNLFLLVAVLFFASPSFAQQGLELTVGYTPGLSFILNDQDFATGKELNITATYGHQLGLTVGYNFNENMGVATGLGFASINQNYVTDFDNVSEQNTFDRRLSYIRVPVLFRIGSDPSRSAGAYFRAGPHFDFLTGATGKYNTNIGIKGSIETNYRDQKTPLTGKKLNVFEQTVIGITMEVGGRIRISDAMGVLVAFHLESTLTNPEGKDASLYFPHDGTVLNRSRDRAWNIMPGIHVGFQYVLSI